MSPIRWFQGSLSRTLTAYLALFVLVGFLALASWLHAWDRQRSLLDLKTLATSNASFVQKMRLPTSPLLAQRLSEVLGTQVGFHAPGEAPKEWPIEVEALLRSLTTGSGPTARRTTGYEVAAAPLPSSKMFLILARPTEHLGLFRGSTIWIPSLMLASICGAVGFLFARSVVTPLGLLTRWLPNLHLSEEEIVPPVPLQVRQRTDEIGRLAQALEDNGGRLREEQRLRHQSERLATLGRIATSLAHEIKNPAAAIGLHADLLLDALPDTQRGAVRMIRQEVERITALVNQWMFVARPRPPQTQRHDLRHILSAVAARLAPALDHAGVRLEIQIEDEEEIATVHVDALRMEQVLQNLIHNAIQAMPEGGRLQIDLVRESTSVTLHMLDQGTGFSAEALQRFGEPFFSEREGGMGIGLAMACEVIEAHSGMLSASNHPSGGGLVTCQLPLVVDALPSAALP